MSNETMCLILTILMAVLSVVLVVCSIIKGRKNQSLKKVWKKILVVVVSLVLVIGTVANAAVYVFSDVLTTVLTKADADPEQVEKDTKASRDLAERIEAEGIVLLENENDCLPFDVTDERQANINVFGWTSVAPVYGGGGSGAGDETKNISLIQGLENAGFHVNQDLVELYNDVNEVRKTTTTATGLFTHDFKIYEADRAAYSEELLQNAKDFSDVALIVLARQGGEDADLPMDMSEWSGDADHHYLELSPEERDMIDMVKEQGFKKVVAVINSSIAMELGFLEEEGIDGAIWIGGPGATGCNSVGKVLAGEVNPSGRLADTYAYDITTSPAYYNAGEFYYDNVHAVNEALMPPMTDSDLPQAFVDYVEGIYVGYRYYETRWIDNETGLCDEESYREAVQYPFGYGLSYTDFTQEITDFHADDKSIVMDVKVTNNGDTAGKDVVQLYYTAPYTVGGIEKSHVVLGAFDKTELLEPGESENVTLTLAVEDMASYDYANEKCYVLDAGDYEIKLMNNSHEVIDSRTYAVNSKIVYNENNKRESDDIAAVNQFDDVTYGEEITYVSRADWEGTLPTSRTENRNAPEDVVARLTSTEVPVNPDDEEIVVKDNGLTLADMKGLDYDDPQWDLLLEQISVKEMANLVGKCGYNTEPIKSIDKPLTCQTEGPAGMNSFMNGTSGVQFPSAVTIASTFNVDLAKEMGEKVGDECNTNGFDGIMGPAMNIHRTPFSGRNFEYYSEDGYLSGMMGAHVAQGYNEKGINTFIKHFALNDQETNRCGVCVWANEQAMREVYMKSFELATKVGGTQGMMSAFNRLGTTWCGASSALLTTVLRDEWGFCGSVVSDMTVLSYQNVDLAVRAGNDFMLTPMGSYPTEVTTETNTGHQALRKSTHNILYSIVNSSALEAAAKQHTAPYPAALLGLDIVILAIAALALHGLTRKKKESQL